MSAPVKGYRAFAAGSARSALWPGKPTRFRRPTPWLMLLASVTEPRSIAMQDQETANSYSRAAGQGLDVKVVERLIGGGRREYALAGMRDKDET